MVLQDLIIMVYLVLQYYGIMDDDIIGIYCIIVCWIIYYIVYLLLYYIIV